MEQQDDQTQRLPDDVLAAVLGRLSPRGLAVSRCVRKAWRDTIDARGMLRADLLPLSFAGLFLNFNEYRYSEFFGRPSPPPSSPSEGPGALRPERLVHPWMNGHCNGLLLFYGRVANPATGWSAPLPPPPPKRPEMECFIDDDFLAFDPTESPHYQVFLVPRIPYIELDVLPDEEFMEDPVVDPTMYGMEWPPSSCVLRVFSSLAKRWEERTFSREGEAAGTVLELGTDFAWDKPTAVYWHGALYLHCQKGFVIRLAVSTNTYQVIKPPDGLEPQSCQTIHHMGKSKKGVYYASIKDAFRLEVWVLDESCADRKWVLEHDTHLKLVPDPRQRVHGPWILQEVNYNNDIKLNDEDDDDTTVVEEKFEWNSDDNEEEEHALDTKDMDYKCDGQIDILGFHPFKEIVFLSRYMSRGLAYHLNTSKIQDLGNLCPKHYGITGTRGFMRESFVYTPCWMKQSSVNNP